MSRVFCFHVFVSVFVLVSRGRDSLTVLWRVVAQQSRLSLTLVGVGIHILYEIGKTKTGEERQREKQKEPFEYDETGNKTGCSIYMTTGCRSV